MNIRERHNVCAKYRQALLQLADLVIDLSPMGEKLYRQQETVCKALRDELSDDQSDDYEDKAEDETEES